MPTPYSEDLPVEITTYRSPIDGVVVVEIDQEENAHGDTRIRVFLNDGPIYRGDTEEVSALDQDVALDHARHLEKALEVSGLKRFEQANLFIALDRITAFLKGELSHGGTLVDDPLCRAAGQHRRFTTHTRWECAHVTEVDTDD